MPFGGKTNFYKGGDMSTPITDGPSFLARSKKAVAGGLTALTAGVGASLTGALGDGAQVEDIWTVLAWGVGAFLVGFVGVWITPKNAQ